MKPLTMTSITSRKYLQCFLLLTLAFFLLLATQGFHRTEVFKNDASALVGGNETMLRCEEVPVWFGQLARRASFPPILGNRNGKKLLTIGIATVYREENYLMKTLESLVNESDPEERKETVVVIYLADTQKERKAKQLSMIRHGFKSAIDSGFFQVIESGPEIYPPMDFVQSKRTFNDPAERVLWRSKQVIDFAFLFTYAKSLSTYYLVMEDDIISSTGYISAIKDFIKSHETHHHRWTALHFSGFLGIGLLFHNYDLPDLTKLLIMFFQDQPVDILMRNYIALQVPDETLVRRFPSIFQHIGWKSTLPNKVQKLRDSTFDIAKRRFKNHNPPADIITSMKVYNDFVPEYAYRPSPGIFWGIGKPQDTLDIIFPRPLSLSRIVIISGIPTMRRNQATVLKDTIMDGKLFASPKFLKVAENSSAICDNFSEIAEFKKGDVDVWRDSKGEKGKVQSDKLDVVQCIRVLIGENQKTWITLREIQLFS